MNLTQIKRAYRLFANPIADKATIRHNVRSWLRAVAFLGDKWNCAEVNHVQRSAV